MNSRYIFNTKGEYVAFLVEDYLFNPDCEWIGFCAEGKVYDTKGNFIGDLLKDDRIVRNVLEIGINRLPPLRPLTPLRPLEPLKRLRMTSLPYPFVDVFLDNKYRYDTKNGLLTKVKNFSVLYGCEIWSHDGLFLGKIEKNKYSKSSILNNYGTYGSQFSQNSIFNKYGKYGSPYNKLSLLNPYTKTPPRILMNNEFYKYLSANMGIHNRIDSYEFMIWVEDQKN